MANPSSSSPSVIGDHNTFSKPQFVRLILVALRSLNLPQTLSTLESESHIPLLPPLHSSLLSLSLAGEFPSLISAVDSITNLPPESIPTLHFLIHKHHFLELLQTDLEMAHSLLFKNISPLDLDRKLVHGLAKSLVDLEGAVRVEERERRRMNLVGELMEVMPEWVRVPEGRLERLVEVAVGRQVEECFYHNAAEEVCLFEDHVCGVERIPCKCSQTLSDHKNEVWFVQFSNSGEYLASSSSDCTAIIWTVKDGDTLALKHSLEGHCKPVSFVAWSPDDKMLLTCGNRDVKLWDVKTGTCKVTFSSLANCVINSCAWFPNAKKIVCGSCDPHNRICTCDLEGNELEVWDGERMPKVLDLAVTPDGNQLIICSNREIWIRDFASGKERVISEEHSITSRSLSMSRDGKSLIVNLNSQEIHLWSVCDGSTIPDRFTGHKQGKYVIRSCFGGTNYLFIASGSEDSQVYIWQRHREKPIQVLSGHSMTVNCVSWNPMKPHMLASASDDHTIRIWVSNRNCSKNPPLPLSCIN